MRWLSSALSSAARLDGVVKALSCATFLCDWMYARCGYFKDSMAVRRTGGCALSRVESDVKGAAAAFNGSWGQSRRRWRGQH